MPQQTWSIADDRLTVTTPSSTGRRVVGVFESPQDAERAVFAHEQYPRLLDRIVQLEETSTPGRPGAHLTSREVQVLELVDSGMTAVAIAEELKLAVNTIQQHLVSVRRKYDVRTTRAAVAMARRDGHLS